MMHPLRLWTSSLTHNKVPNLSEDEPQPFADEFVRALKLMLPSYLDEGIPAVAKNR
ncbi:hypothetical protein [Bradyrhizobium sp. USDA 4501]